MAGLDAGDEQAAAVIHARFAQRLIALAAGKLGGALRQKVDAEVLVQSAFKSFFRRQADGTLEIHDWSDLWSVLATITLRKFGYQRRQYLTAKRHVYSEGPLENGDDSSHEGVVALSREPTPAEVAVLSDLVARFLADLPPKGRAIAEFALAGYTVAEIAPKVELTQRSVFRQMERLRERLAKLTAD